MPPLLSIDHSFPIPLGQIDIEQKAGRFKAPFDLVWLCEELGTLFSSWVSGRVLDAVMANFLVSNSRNDALGCLEAT